MCTLHSVPKCMNLQVSTCDRIHRYYRRTHDRCEWCGCVRCLPHGRVLGKRSECAGFFIQSVTSNDASVLPIGKAQYTCFPNDKGGIVDDLLVYHYEPEKYLLVVNAGNIAKDWDWCVSHNTVGAELENSSDRTAQLADPGPESRRSFAAPDSGRPVFHSLLFVCDG